MGTGIEPKTGLWYVDLCDGSMLGMQKKGIRVVLPRGLKSYAAKGTMIYMQGRVLGPGRVEAECLFTIMPGS
jgi:hypothetical protein